MKEKKRLKGRGAETCSQCKILYTEMSALCMTEMWNFYSWLLSIDNLVHVTSVYREGEERKKGEGKEERKEFLWVQSTEWWLSTNNHFNPTVHCLLGLLEHSTVSRQRLDERINMGCLVEVVMWELGCCFLPWRAQPWSGRSISLLGSMPSATCLICCYCRDRTSL